MSQAVRSAFLGFAAGLLLPGAALAGPPFMTDDPEPTDPGHWEIYAPLVESEGKGSDYEGSAGVEINYGAAPNLQLTVALPVDYAHDESGFHSGPGDVELSAKYRFYHDEDAALSVAFFPGITLPTGGHASKKSARIVTYGGQRMSMSTHLANRVRQMLADRNDWGRFPDDVSEWLEVQSERSLLPEPHQLLVETFPHGRP